jgi:hypothetical protein
MKLRYELVNDQPYNDDFYKGDSEKPEPRISRTAVPDEPFENSDQWANWIHQQYISELRNKKTA